LIINLRTTTMAFGKLWTIAWRDLGRNRRRSFFSVLAVGLGLGLLILLNGYIKGVMEESLENSIRLETGHLQLRAATYEAEQASLLWEDLLAEPQALADQAMSLNDVEAAAPVLWAGGYLNTRDESVGLRIFGIETRSPIYVPFRDAMYAGEYLAPDDRSGILIGKRLAEGLKLNVGDTVNLAIVNASGELDESPFDVRGIFETGVYMYDDGAVLMPLAKAQAFAGVGDRASAVTMLLHDQEAADGVAAALQSPVVEALTWRNLNEVFISTIDTAMSFYIFIYGIVILIVAVLIANTLLMAVFERFREIGILSALGMR
jgi:ABC-type lipoprotein release transport system permease subunit